MLDKLQYYNLIVILRCGSGSTKLLNLWLTKLSSSFKLTSLKQIMKLFKFTFTTCNTPTQGSKI